MNICEQWRARYSRIEFIAMSAALYVRKLRNEREWSIQLHAGIAADCYDHPESYDYEFDEFDDID